MTIPFLLTSVFLGVGLAMDAFSVSLANGLQEPGMRPGRMCALAGVFGAFQAIMPLIGWLCVHTIVGQFRQFEGVIPWIAFGLLGYIGGKMLVEGVRFRGEDPGHTRTLSLPALLLQGVATSIDALSVGFTIADDPWPLALTAALLIAVVTWCICLAGLALGKRFGIWLSGKAEILGGSILIAIGLSIVIRSLLS